MELRLESSVSPAEEHFASIDRYEELEIWNLAVIAENPIR